MEWGNNWSNEDNTEEGITKIPFSQVALIMENLYKVGS